MSVLTRSAVSHRTDWFCKARWGIAKHFLAEVFGANLGSDEWNQLVDGFDVQGLAEQLVAVHAPYFLITLGQNTGHYCSPNATYDRLTGIRPSKCSQRDLVADLHAALWPHGIRLMVYLPSGAPMHDQAAAQALEWRCSGGDRFANFQRKWEAIIREWSLRWGDKISGWWIDGCYWNDDLYRHDDEPNFKSFAAALRAGNSQSIVAWNPGVKYPPFTVDAEEDYTAGEINEPQEVDSPGRWDKQAQFHMLSYLGQTWARGPIRFTDAQAIEYTRSLTDFGGVVTWDVPSLRNGLIDDSFFEQLKNIGAAIEASRVQPHPLPPPSRPRIRVSFPSSPCIFLDGTTRQGCLSVQIQNPWNKPIAGEIRIESDPQNSIKIQTSGRIAYRIDSLGQTESRLVFEMNGVGNPQAAPKLLLTRDDDSRVFSYLLPMHREFILPSALSDAPAHAIRALGQELADVRLAMTGQHLLVHAIVRDRKMMQTPLLWDGSCIEVFAAEKDGAPIGHAMLAPAVGGASAVARWALPDGSVRPAKDIELTTVANEAGYELHAKLPRKMLVGSDDLLNPPLLELAVSATPQPDGAPMRGFLFDSNNAHASSASYGQAQLSKR